MERKLFDKRTMDRYVEKGVTKAEEAKAHMKALPDDTANAQWVEVDLHDTEGSEEGGSDESEAT